ncbi:hypothetical protein GCM10027035_29280 [Emticicia sediminis]
MDLFKTTRLPAGQAGADALKNFITTQPFVIMVMAGNDPTMAGIADVIAGGNIAENHRRVLWADTPPYEPIIDLLKTFPAKPLVINKFDEGATFKAVFISLSGVICDGITAEDELNKAKIAIGFIRAEADRTVSPDRMSSLSAGLN